jgi:hypothetical protein
LRVLTTAVTGCPATPFTSGVTCKVYDLFGRRLVSVFDAGKTASEPDSQAPPPVAERPLRPTLTWSTRVPDARVHRTVAVEAVADALTRTGASALDLSEPAGTADRVATL